MNEYSHLGLTSPIDRVDYSQAHYVIPHYGVLKPQSTTTKLRALFEASASTTSGVSLNDILLV